jgi:hypothetical protein
LDDRLTAWKIFIPPRIKIGEDTYVNRFLCANDQIILQESENALQISIHKLLQRAVEHNLKTSNKKTKTLEFDRKYPIRTKILIYNETIKEVSHFSYLGCDVTYEVNNDIQNKLNKFRKYVALSPYL